MMKLILFILRFEIYESRVESDQWEILQIYPSLNLHQEHIFFLFQFFDFCPTWTSEVDENPETYVEQNLFLESVEVEDTILRVNLKLGFLFGKNSPGNGK